LGKLVGVAPGGGFEAQLGTSDYKVMWKKRSGFAAVAFEAKVPIIPVFTENIREAFVNMQTGQSIWQFIYRYDFDTKL
jgi:1-acyl-sn-glycerol-3-phosphate acyltransferase